MILRLQYGMVEQVGPVNLHILSRFTLLYVWIFRPSHFFRQKEEHNKPLVKQHDN